MNIYIISVLLCCLFLYKILCIKREYFTNIDFSKSLYVVKDSNGNNYYLINNTPSYVFDDQTEKTDNNIKLVPPKIGKPTESIVNEINNLINGAQEIKSNKADIVGGLKYMFGQLNTNITLKKIDNIKFKYTPNDETKNMINGLYQNFINTKKQLDNLDFEIDNKISYDQVDNQYINEIINNYKNSLNIIQSLTEQKNNYDNIIQFAENGYDAPKPPEPVLNTVEFDKNNLELIGKLKGEKEKELSKIKDEQYKKEQEDKQKEIALFQNKVDEQKEKEKQNIINYEKRLNEQKEQNSAEIIRRENELYNTFMTKRKQTLDEFTKQRNEQDKLAREKRESLLAIINA